MKRVLSIVLSLILSFTLAQSCLTAWAGELTYVHKTTFTESGNKTVAKTTTALASKASLEQPDELKERVFVEDYEEACLFVRDELMKMNEKISFYMPYSEEYSTEASVRNIVYLARSCDISTCCKDGDYLLFNNLFKGNIENYNVTYNDKLYTAVDLYFDYRSTPEQEALVDEKINELLPTLIGDTDYDTLKNIHDYICETVTYYYAAENVKIKEKQLVYYALFYHKIVCGGYSSFFYRLARQAGFDVRIVYLDELNHAWNIIKLDGKWYYVDCTWDDRDNAVDDDNSTVTEQNTIYNYFLKGANDFENHGDLSLLKVGSETKSVDNFELADTQYEVQDCAEHEFEAYSTENAPCSELYCNVLKCKNCNALKRVSADAGKHTSKSYEGVAPSCISTGTSAGEYCSVCHKALNPRKVVTETGHTPTETVVPAALGKDGVIHTYCDICGVEFPDKSISAIKTVVLSKSLFYYNGKKQKPYVIAIDSEDYSVPVSSYKVIYPEDIKTPGKHAVKIVFSGNYKATVKLNYNIRLNAAYIKKSMCSSDYIKLYFNKAESVSGYYVRYSTDKSFKNNVKNVKIKGNKNTVKKLKKLKSNKRYYIKVRTYKKIGDKTYYSKFSDVYKLKTT